MTQLDSKTWLEVTLRFFEVDYVKEYRFHHKRRWKFDYAVLDSKIAVEYEGGTFCGGRHINPVGYSNDCEKYSTAALMGWKVVRITANMIKDGRAYTLLEEAFYA